MAPLLSLIRPDSFVAACAVALGLFFAPFSVFCFSLFSAPKKKQKNFCILQK
jgi:hypothetical protein